MTKTFYINREFQEEVVVIQPVFHKVDVNIEDITHNDIMKMEFNTLRSYAMSMRMLLAERSFIVVDPQPIVEVIALETPTVTENDTDSSREDGDGSGRGGTVGAKRGISSRHHYVYWNTGRHAWGNNFTNDIFDNEDKCALFVNKYLDDIGDNDRPRNLVEEVEHETDRT